MRRLSSVAHGENWGRVCLDTRCMTLAGYWYAGLPGRFRAPGKAHWTPVYVDPAAATTSVEQSRRWVTDSIRADLHASRSSLVPKRMLRARFGHRRRSPGGMQDWKANAARHPHVNRARGLDNLFACRGLHGTTPSKKQRNTVLLFHHVPSPESGSTSHRSHTGEIWQPTTWPLCALSLAYFTHLMFPCSVPV